jgi:hypothetical protein
MSFDNTFSDDNDDDDNSFYNRKPPARVSDHGGNDYFTDDDDDVIEQKCKCQIAFEANNESYKYLFAMAYGAVDEQGKVLYDIKEEPYKSASKRKSFKPGKEDLIKENQRRHKLFNPNTAKPRRCSSYSYTELLEYLEKNPITELIERKFLQEKIVSFCTSLEAAKAEETLTATGSWNKDEHYWRLYHCLIEDDITALYLIRDLPLSRSQLDGMRSDVRSPTFYESLAKRYNDETFNPESISFPDEHPNFTEVVTLSQSKSPVPTDSEKVKSKLSTCRVKLMLVRETYQP